MNAAFALLGTIHFYRAKHTTLILSKGKEYSRKGISGGLESAALVFMEFPGKDS